MNALENAILGKNTNATISTGVANPWTAVQKARADDAWIDDMLKGGMIGPDQASELKLKAAQGATPSDELYNDPKFLDKVFK